MKPKYSILIALLACSWACSAKAAKVVLAAEADTFTQYGVNAGSAQNLDVLELGGNNSTAYIRFDLSGLTNVNITGATLTLHETGGTRNDHIITARHEVYGLTDHEGNTPQDWDESLDLDPGAEYTNVGGNDIDSSVVFVLDPEQGADVSEIIPDVDNVDASISGPDLVAFLNQRLAAGGKTTFIVAIDAGDAYRGYGFASREHVSENPPTLTIQSDAYPENPVRFARQAEDLNRGVVAVRSSSSQVYVGWRMLGTDDTNIAFNLYRASNGSAPVKLNAAPLTQTTDYVDSPASFSVSHTYFVRPVVDSIELAESETFTLPAGAPVRQYLEIPLQIPAGGTTPDDVSYAYSANDCSVGDLDGDGELEIVLKWDPSNAKDNSQSGYTGNVYLDGYKLDGTLMWRIDLGVNIRAGAHYTQFQVYDLDGDGRAEVACRTAPGTLDGQGNDVILPGDNPDADYRNSDGRILTGPEYLTVFEGLTGAELVTTNFTPDRVNVSQWGDNYGNRSDRFLAGIAYLDGRRPSLIMARGYYGPRSGYSARNEITAWNWRDGQLTREWWFKAGLGINGNINSGYIGQGSHQLSVADVDGDGRDEIIYGACSIDDDGTGLYTTGLGHGDALHVSDMDPDNPGLEVFMPHEDENAYSTVGAGGELRDAMTGELLMNIPSSGDVGRGVAMDIDPNHPGYEFWASTADPGGGDRMIYNVQDGPIYTAGNVFYNFGVWWDADLTRELLDGTTISEWLNPGRSNLDLDPATGGTQSYAPDCSSNNGTKSTPCLSGDILGDWREEVIWRKSDNTALRIFTTIIPAANRMPTLLHDIQYREALAWQNTAYNQPPHPGFFLGADMDPAPTPDIYLAGTSRPVPIMLAISNNVIFFASTSNGSYRIDSKTSLTNAWELFTNIVATGTNTQLTLPMTDETMYFRGEEQ